MRRRLFLLGLVLLFGLVLVAGGRTQQRLRAGAAEPFRIAGNFYYVGANDVSAFLITGPEATSCSTAATPPPRR